MAERIAEADLARLRRDLKEVAPAVKKDLDRELKETARSVARIAAALSVHRSGTFAAGWKASLTARGGASVRNAVVYARQQEYGAQVWLRRGLPYRDATPGSVPTATSNLPTRQVSLGGDLVVNEARYLIRRSNPGGRAVRQELPRSIERIADSVTRATERALS